MASSTGNAGTTFDLPTSIVNRMHRVLLCPSCKKAHLNPRRRTNSTGSHSPRYECVSCGEPFTVADMVTPCYEETARGGRCKKPEDVCPHHEQ